VAQTVRHLDKGNTVKVTENIKINLYINHYDYCVSISPIIYVSKEMVQRSRLSTLKRSSLRGDNWILFVRPTDYVDLVRVTSEL